MRYVKPFYREVYDDNDENRFGGVLIPFIGGALIGGLFASSYNQNHAPTYYPYNPYPMNYYYPYQTYPSYYPYINTN